MLFPVVLLFASLFIGAGAGVAVWSLGVVGWGVGAGGGGVQGGSG